MDAMKFVRDGNLLILGREDGLVGFCPHAVLAYGVDQPSVAGSVRAGVSRALALPH